MRTSSWIEAGNVVQLGLARGGGLGLVGWGLLCGETSKTWIQSRDLGSPPRSDLVQCRN